MTQFLKSKELHKQTIALLNGNVWNVQSIMMFEKINFKLLELQVQQ